MIKFFLTLFFTCGHGCGEPPQVTLEKSFDTLAQCEAVAQVFTSTAANPTHAIARTECKPVRRR